MHHTTDRAQLAALCAAALSFSELAAIGLRELRLFDGGAGLVCGPITTGGLSNPLDNLKAFDVAIKCLKDEGAPIFDQTPYEDAIFGLRTKWRAEDPSRAHAYCMPILLEFYQPIIESGAITTGFFLPGFEFSTGATWEYKKLHACGVNIVRITPAWLQRRMAEHAS